MLHILLYNYIAGKWRIIPLCFCVSRSFKMSLFKSLFCKKCKRRSTSTLLEKKCGSISRSLQTNKFSYNRYRSHCLKNTIDRWWSFIQSKSFWYRSALCLGIDGDFLNEINGKTGLLLSFFFLEERHVATRHNFIVTIISDGSASRFMAPPLSFTWLVFCVPLDDYRFLMW